MRMLLIPSSHTTSLKIAKTCLSPHSLGAVQCMFRAMENAGCGVDPFKFVQCMHCPQMLAGALTQEEGRSMEICMCQNRVGSQRHFDHVLTHELIHAYDVCRAEVDFSNPLHHACTEIRAANI